MKNTLSSAATLLVFVLVVSIPAALGFYVGRYMERQEQLINHLSDKNASASDESSEVAAAKKPMKSGVPTDKNANIMLPKDLAKAKGVPEKVTGAQGEFTLVSVVEGAEVNQQLSDNLRLVTAQRQQLGTLAQQFEKTATSAVQQRELLAGQMNEVKMALQRNLVVMAQSYSYSLANSYLRVPHVVSLLSVTETDGKFTTQPVHKFATADAYLEFQKKNDTYQRMKLELAKDQPKPTVGDGEDEKPVASAPASQEATAKAKEQTAKLKAIQAEMISHYQFDPEKRYLLQFEKTALYARPTK